MAAVVKHFMGFLEQFRRRLPAVRKAAFAAVALVAFGQTAAPVQAVEINNSLIAAPSIVVVEAGTERTLGLAISPSGAIPRTSMLLIKGLPQTSVLSAGRVFESGTWALRFRDLQNLSIQTTLTTSGQSPLTLSVVTLEGTVLAQREITLKVVPRHVAPAVPVARRAVPPVRVVTPTASQETARR